MPPPPPYEEVSCKVPLTQQPAHQTIVNRANNVPSSNFINTSSREEDYLIPAVISCFCCFWPTGICGVVAAIKARSKFDNGDYVGGHKMAKKALAFSIASFVIGFASLIILTFLWQMGRDWTKWYGFEYRNTHI